jgi:hypothetical protein
MNRERKKVCVDGSRRWEKICQAAPRFAKTGFAKTRGEAGSLEPARVELGASAQEVSAPRVSCATGLPGYSLSPIGHPFETPD